MTQIHLDPDALSQIASKAIFDAISTEQKEKVVLQAVQSLMTPDRTGYGQPQTPLQKAFDSALRTVSFEIAREVIAENPEYREKVRQLLISAASEAFTMEGEASERMRRTLADVLATAMTDRRDD